jgi:hypothetical protein
MAKDAKGHGSEKRGEFMDKYGATGGTMASRSVGAMPIPGHAFHTKTNDELHFIAKDANAAAENFKNSGMTVPGSTMLTENKYRDQVNDAASVLGWRARGGRDLSQSPAVDVAAQHGISTDHLTGDNGASHAAQVQSWVDAAQKRQDDFERNGDKY